MNRKKLISAIIITKNEEVRIESCIKNLSFADEIIVVDNGSTDKTVQIAQRFRARITHDETDDFSALRNAGAKQANGEWLLYVDGDETVNAKLRDEIQSVTKKPTASAYFIPRQNYYLNTFWPSQDGMIRLIKKTQLKGWVGVVHEHPVIDGEVKTLKNHFIHHTHRSLEEMVAKTNEWSAHEAQLRFDAGHPPITWWRFLRVMGTAFLRSFVTDGGWKTGATGWIESIYQSFSMFITYAKLWEMQGKQKT